MKNLIITINEATEENGFYYDIWENEEDKENGDSSIDGGFCTTTIENALEMATEQAKKILSITNNK